jgi:glycosyltransferase involved in cell wall biosynthesis
MTAKRRIAVVTPSLDKRHGTERCVAEQVERLTRDFGYDVHVYSRSVTDVAGLTTCGSGPRAGGSGPVDWHRIAGLPGPGLIKYLWWFAANQLRRWWDDKVRGIKYDLVYSPGINCLDAKVISVHIVFAEFRERVAPDLEFWRNPIATWPRILHRRLYYRLIIALEGRVYPHKDVALCAVSRKTAYDLSRFYSRNGDVAVVYLGVDLEQFSPSVRARHRLRARQDVGLSDGDFCLLLIGNDWRKKGLLCLLDAVRQIEDTRLRVLVVGKDDRTLFETQARAFGLEGRVRFLPLRPDVEFYYAAADAYVGPSLEDAFALPPAEAMACGLPVIVSSQAGVSEIVSNGVDGLILRDPRDAKELAGLIRGLVEDADLRHRLGEQAVHTAQKYTWERNAAETAAFLENAMRRRRQP